MHLNLRKYITKFRSTRLHLPRMKQWSAAATRNLRPCLLVNQELIIHAFLSLFLSLMKHSRQILFANFSQTNFEKLHPCKIPENTQLHYLNFISGSLLLSTSHFRIAFLFSISTYYSSLSNQNDKIFIRSTTRRKFQFS